VTNTGQSPEIDSGAALFTFDESKRIRSWNKAAEELTGIGADEVVGRPCWEVLCGHDDAGGIVCHTGCSFHRLLCESFPVSPPTVVIKTATGRRRVTLPMIRVQDRTLFAALMLEPGEPAEPTPAPSHNGPLPALTPRQMTVLTMLAEGKPAREIAEEFHLSEMTVRNHIRAILRELGCNSQLTAVAKARRLGLV
jgi:DNA-binding CsgD family transcriptional regulator